MVWYLWSIWFPVMKELLHKETLHRTRPSTWLQELGHAKLVGMIINFCMPTIGDSWEWTGKLHCMWIVVKGIVEVSGVAFSPATAGNQSFRACCAEVWKLDCVFTCLRRRASQCCEANVEQVLVDGIWRRVRWFNSFTCGHIKRTYR